MAGPRTETGAGASSASIITCISSPEAMMLSRFIGTRGLRMTGGLRAWSRVSDHVSAKVKRMTGETSA